MITDNSKLHAPTWVKLISLISLLVAFIMACWVVYKYLGQNKHEWILIAISLAQIALTGIVFLIIYFFSERDKSTESLRKMSEKFIAREIVQSLQKIELHFANNANPVVTVEKKWSGIFGKNIKISHGDYHANLWVGVNVNKIWCIYTFEDFTNGSDPKGVKLRDKLSSSIDGAVQTGYNINITRVCSEKNCDDVGAFYLWATVIDEENQSMLSNSHRRLFFANDIAMMTHSILNSAYREGIATSEMYIPRPL